MRANGYSDGDAGVDAVAVASTRSRSGVASSGIGIGSMAWKFEEPSWPPIRSPCSLWCGVMLFGRPQSRRHWVVQVAQVAYAGGGGKRAGRTVRKREQGAGPKALGQRRWAAIVLPYYPLTVPLCNA